MDPLVNRENFLPTFMVERRFLRSNRENSIAQPAAHENERGIDIVASALALTLLRIAERDGLIPLCQDETENS